MPAIKGDMYINTHCNYSQPTLIKLYNENIGGHLTPLQMATANDNTIAVLDNANVQTIVEHHNCKICFRHFCTINLGTTNSVLNNSYFHSFSLITFLFRLIFVFLQLTTKYSRYRSHKMTGNNFSFSFKF